MGERRLSGGGSLSATSLAFTRVGGSTAHKSGPQLASGASDDPSLAVDKQFSSSSCLAHAWGMVHGGRQESPFLLPTPTQGPQNTFEERLNPGNREWPSTPAPVLMGSHGSEPCSPGQGLPMVQVLWVSLPRSQAVTVVWAMGSTLSPSCCVTLGKPLCGPVKCRVGRFRL